MGLEGVVTGGFAGAGNTLPPVVVSVAFSILRILCGAPVSARYGIQGLAWVITLTCVARSLLTTGWFLRGGWTQHRLNA